MKNGYEYNKKRLFELPFIKSRKLLPRADENEKDELKDAILNNKPAILVNTTKNEEYAINYDLSQRQKDIILAGGLLNYTKESF